MSRSDDESSIASGLNSDQEMRLNIHYLRNSHLATGSIDDGLSVSQKAFLARNLGNKWLDLARDGLCLSSAQVEQIRNQFPLDVIAQARRALDMWMEIKGSQATLTPLIEALKTIGRTDLAEGIKDVPPNPMAGLHEFSDPEEPSSPDIRQRRDQPNNEQEENDGLIVISALDGVHSLDMLMWILRQGWLLVILFVFVGLDFISRYYFCNTYGCDLPSTWFCPFVINLLLRTVVAASGPLMLEHLIRAGEDVDLPFSKKFLTDWYRDHLITPGRTDTLLENAEDLAGEMKINLKLTACQFFGWSSGHALFMTAICLMLSRHYPDLYQDMSTSVVDIWWSCMNILADAAVSAVALVSMGSVIALYHCYRDLLRLILKHNDHSTVAIKKLSDQMNRIIKRVTVLAFVVVLGFAAEVVMAAIFVTKADHSSEPQVRVSDEHSLDILFLFVMMTVALASCPLMITKVFAVVLDIFLLLKTLYFIFWVKEQSCLVNSIMEYHLIALTLAATLALHEMTLWFSAIRRSEQTPQLCYIIHWTFALLLCICFILKSTFVS